MSNRSWFFASEGTQQGPYPEDQLRDFIAHGTVRRRYAGLDRGHGGLAEGRRYSGPAGRRLAAPRTPLAIRAMEVAPLTGRAAMPALRFRPISASGRSSGAASVLPHRLRAGHSGAMGGRRLLRDGSSPGVQVPGRPNLDLHRPADGHLVRCSCCSRWRSYVRRAPASTISQFILFRCRPVCLGC